ncbi:MAG TPA: cobyric acid synthase [Polyangiaceae bacterium]|nr:cobyric acid synthase [Polyangiaceae bacterium]
MLARTLMVQGTASSVGKSLLVAALCRLFRQDGFDVAPFKSQNMALNSAVTPDGLEIGRAQAVQAEAAGLPASVDMNPILLKPEGSRRSQVVVLGKPQATLSAREYHEYKLELQGVVARSLERLRRRHQLVIIEGAGSPAEINLKARDLVNMHVARLAEAPVLLVGDIDRGGVFAALVGTLELLEPDERARVAALVINNFRGDPALLEPGLEFIQRRTGKPVLGVVPHVPQLRIADEDSVSLQQRMARQRPGRAEIDVAVVRLPHLSNYDDVLELEHEPGVTVRFAQEPAELRGADLLILPGSKSTLSDLSWLRRSGLAAQIARQAHAGGLVLGICGGCQMLGQWIEDPERVESREALVPGLGLLDSSTRFAADKRTTQVEARCELACFLGEGAPSAVPLTGYEIHMGRITLGPTTRSPFRLSSRNGQPVEARDGAINATGNVIGTMLHGLFANESLRRSLLLGLRERRGLSAPSAAALPARDAEYDRLAATVRQAFDLSLLRRLIGAA